MKFLIPMVFSVLVSWNQNTESDLCGYRIYYGSRSGEYNNYINSYSTSIKINNVSISPTQMLGYDANIIYVVVTAYDFSGNESDYSEEVSLIISYNNYIIGDLDGDGFIEISDSWDVWDRLYTRYGDLLYHPSGDVDEDSLITLQDVWTVYDMIGK